MNALKNVQGVSIGAYIAGYPKEVQKLLTPDFTKRRWHSRAEMAMLTANILQFNESEASH